MNTLRQNLSGYIFAVIGLMLVVFVFKQLITNVNNTTVALSLLVVVQITAAISRLNAAIFASIAGMFCFNYFFLPPFGTLTIEDPQNWVALSAFLVTAVIASKLSASARARADEAEKRRAEVWKLYELGRAIIATPDSETATNAIARQVVDVFDLEFCAVFIREAATNLVQVSFGGKNSATLEIPLPSDILEQVFNTGELQSAIVDIKAGQLDPTVNLTTIELTFTPLKVGVRSTGVMALASARLERGPIDAIAGLVALALERARFLQEVSNTAALRQSDELKSALLASVSHSLRTPLTAIRTSIDSILRKDFALDSATLHEFHLIISEEADRLTRLVNNLLDMARIEAGDLQPTKQWCSISEIVNNSLDRCATSLQKHKLTVEVDERLPVMKLDSQLLAEVLTNLLENAAKYSPVNKLIKIDAAVTESKLIIRVADQGPGIPPAERERIFDKFYRGQKETNRSIPGTGMGLTIARGIVEAHGGKLWVENGQDKGAIFQFVIPVECQDSSQRLLVEEL